MLYFFIMMCDLLSCSGKWKSASKVAIQANCPLTFSLPFCCDAMQIFNFSFVKYVHLSEKYVLFFLSASVKVYSQRRYIFAINVKYSFKVIILWFLLYVSVLFCEQHFELPCIVSSFSSETPPQKIETKKPKQNGEESQCG